MLEVVRAFEEASGRPVPYEICPPRLGDVASSYASCKRAEEELGWKAKLGMIDMCKLSFCFDFAAISDSIFL